MANFIEIFSLHRYFIWANKMRTDFDSILAKLSTGAGNEESMKIESNIYMSYWYGGLYVVIEGWKTLQLSDPIIDKLLLSPNIDLLRRYRNGVFHFQRDYSDKRFTGFILEGENTVEWVRGLNKAFGKWFLEWLEKNRS